MSEAETKAICKDKCAAASPIATAACTALFPEFEVWCKVAGDFADETCEAACDTPQCNADSECSGVDKFGSKIDTCINNQCIHKYAEADCKGIDPDKKVCKFGTFINNQQCECSPSQTTCAGVWNSVAQECIDGVAKGNALSCCKDAFGKNWIGVATCNNFNDSTMVAKSWFLPPGDWDGCIDECSGHRCHDN